MVYIIKNARPPKKRGYRKYITNIVDNVDNVDNVDKFKGKILQTPSREKATFTKR